MDTLQPSAPIPLDDVVRAAVENALRFHEGNKARAAQSLDIYRPRLYSLISKYKLEGIGVPRSPVSRKRRSGKVIKKGLMKDVERRAIEAVLLHTEYNQTKAAPLLGISPSTLYRRLQSYRREALAR